MPVPKRKTSKARRDQRQSNKFIRPQAITACSNCTKALSPHQACEHCGYYKGKKIFATKMERTIKRSQERTKSQKLRQEKMAKHGGSHEGHDHEQEGHEHNESKK